MAACISSVFSLYVFMYFLSPKSERTDKWGEHKIIGNGKRGWDGKRLGTEKRLGIEKRMGMGKGGDRNLTGIKNPHNRRVIGQGL